MTFLPNKYQRLVYIFIQKGKGNAVIDAVAGSGKSTTIVNALKLIPKNKKVLFLAFNKAIVEELKIKVGNLPNVEIRTLHSLGASAVMRQTGAKLSDDKYKAWVNNGIKYGSLAPRFSNLPDEQLSDWKQNILHLIDLGRVNLVDNIRDLESLAYKHNLDLIDNEATLALAGIDWGKREIDHIDFTDMIYFPNVKQIRMPQYDWVFIDECQDLNAAQREMFLKCIKPGGRFIAVGDPRQAIYGFAGADVESFNILKNLPHTAKLPLSLCYRCDTDIVDLAKEYHLNVIFDTEEEEIITAIDVEKIVRVILILLSNSIKFSKEKGDICVEMRREDEEVVIKVTDNGIGINEDMKDKIFDKFKRVQSVSNLNEDHEGSGLGLYIAKGFIELHNGSISVVSEVEKGSTFIITIPIVIIKNDLHNIKHMDEDELNRIIKIELSDL